MGFNPFKAVKKAVKKLTKSDLGKLALGVGAFMYGPKLMPGYQPLGGKGGWTAAMKGLPPWLYSPASGAPTPKDASGIIGKGINFAKAHPYITAGAATIGAGKLADVPEEDVPEVDDGRGHADYVRGRKGYLAEWAEWKAEQEGISYAEALADLEANPMFSASQGGRVKAQGGLFAGQMAGRHPGMNQMNQGLGAPNLGSRSMGMTPGMGGGQDPRMAQLMQGQGRPRTATPTQSEDTELIQLIKMLTSLGIPMEQLRGRTKEELVEMLVSVSGKGGGEEVVEEDVIEEQDIREQQAAGGGLMRTGYATGGDDSIFIDESMEVLKGGQDGDVELQENIEMASGPYEGTSADADEHAIRLFGKPYHQLNPAEIEELQIEMDRLQKKFMNQGGIARTGYAMGTEHPVIPSKDGNQLDMRDRGGYQPHGAQEKKDDVRALLAQGEFVMTSDAVKGMGGGDREQGAKKMYNLMHNMEAMA